VYRPAGMGCHQRFAYELRLVGMCVWDKNLLVPPVQCLRVFGSFLVVDSEEIHDVPEGASEFSTVYLTWASRPGMKVRILRDRSRSLC
jgi:hypothetical protein